MNRECANRGGNGSIVRLDAPARLDEPLELCAAATRALECWSPRPGEIFTVVDPEETFYRARLIKWSPQRSVILPFEALRRSVESSVQIEIYQALPEKERFELVLQKLTEIGVHRIIPYTSLRSTTLEERDGRQRKSHRWPEVLLRAARQCRRAMIPSLSPVLSWGAALSQGSEADLKLLLFEGESACTLREGIAAGGARVALFVGPRETPMVKRVASVRPRGTAQTTVLRSLDPDETTWWVVGDNSRVSEDSRRFGPVPRHRFRGRVIFRYWPPSRVGSIR